MSGAIRVNVASVEASAALQVDSTTQGVLFPRMTEAQRDAISSPATGLVVYNTDTDTYDVYNGAAWVILGTGATPGAHTHAAADVTSGQLALERGGTESDLSATGPGHLVQASAGAALTVRLDNLAGTTAPTAGDDTGDGYSVGSRWYDTTNDKEYVCLDATAAAAVWKETTVSGGVTDADAIHDNVAGEIAALTEVTPASGDWVLIEDVSDENNKKKVQAGNLGGGGGGTAWDDSIVARLSGSNASDDEFSDASFSGWTTVEDASPNITVTEAGDLLSISHPGGDSSAELHALMKAIPGTPTAPLTIETAIRSMPRNAQDYAVMGLIFADGATYGAGTQVMGHVLHGIAGLSTTYQHLRLARFTNYNTFGAASYTNALHRGSTPFLHLRLTWVSANTWRFEYSPDGVSWVSGAASDSAHTMTPTHFGVTVSTYSGPSPTIFTFDHFRVS